MVGIEFLFYKLNFLANWRRTLLYK